MRVICTAHLQARAPVHAQRQGAHIKVQLAAARRAAEIHEASIERFPTCIGLLFWAPAHALIGCSQALATRFHATVTFSFALFRRTSSAPKGSFRECRTHVQTAGCPLLCCAALTPVVFPPPRPWNCLGPFMQGTTPALSFTRPQHSSFAAAVPPSSLLLHDMYSTRLSAVYA